MFMPRLTVCGIHMETERIEHSTVFTIQLKKVAKASRCWNYSAEGVKTRLVNIYEFAFKETMSNLQHITQPWVRSQAQPKYYLAIALLNITKTTARTWNGYYWSDYICVTTKRLQPTSEQDSSICIVLNSSTDDKDVGCKSSDFSKAVISTYSELQVREISWSTTEMDDSTWVLSAV